MRMQEAQWTGARDPITSATRLDETLGAAVVSPKPPIAWCFAPFREEFTNYMFLERAQEAAGVNAENWKLFPQV